MDKINNLVILCQWRSYSKPTCLKLMKNGAIFTTNQDFIQMSLIKKSFSPINLGQAGRKPKILKFKQEFRIVDSYVVILRQKSMLNLIKLQKFSAISVKTNTGIQISKKPKKSCKFQMTVKLLI